MTGIIVALHLVACPPDLLTCKDLSNPNQHWADIGLCEDVRPRLIARAKAEVPPHVVVMARCRYLIAGDRRSAEMF